MPERPLKPAPDQKTRRWIGYAARVALGLALVFWLAGRGGAREIITSLSGVSPGWFLLAFAAYVAGQSLCAWKWSVLGAGLGFRRPLAFYWVNYVGATFPSLFLPTSLGGDVFRSVALGRGGDSVRAVVSVLADRGTGFLAMISIAAVASLLDVSGGKLPSAVAGFLYAGCGILTVGFLLPFAISERLAKWKIGKVPVGAVLECWQKPRVLFTALAAAFVFQLLSCLIYALMGHALGVDVPLPFYFLVCPLVSVAALSPLTINALGERTAVLVMLMSLAGAPRSQAIAFSLLSVALGALMSLFGGLVLLVSRDRAPAPADPVTAEVPLG